MDGWDRDAVLVFKMYLKGLLCKASLTTGQAIFTASSAKVNGFSKELPLPSFTRDGKSPSRVSPQLAQLFYRSCVWFHKPTTKVLSGNFWGVSH